VQRQISRGRRRASPFAVEFGPVCRGRPQNDRGRTQCWPFCRAPGWAKTLGRDIRGRTGAAPTGPAGERHGDATGALVRLGPGRPVPRIHWTSDRLRYIVIDHNMSTISCGQTTRSRRIIDRCTETDCTRNRCEARDAVRSGTTCWPSGRRNGGRAWRGGGHRRMRRGDIRTALLVALGDGPGHGYELIGRLEEKSAGTWRPSPGSVYPTLQLFEDEGLVKMEERDDKRVYALTDAGRAEAAERVERFGRLPGSPGPRPTARTWRCARPRHSCSRRPSRWLRPPTQRRSSGPPRLSAPPARSCTRSCPNRDRTRAGRRGRLPSCHAPMAWTPPSTWTISPVVAGNQSDNRATQARATGSASLTSHRAGRARPRWLRSRRNSGWIWPPSSAPVRPPPD